MCGVADSAEVYGVTYGQPTQKLMLCQRVGRSKRARLRVPEHLLRPAYQKGEIERRTEKFSRNPASLAVGRRRRKYRDARRFLRSRYCRNSRDERRGGMRRNDPLQIAARIR